MVRIVINEPMPIAISPIPIILFSAIFLEEIKYAIEDARLKEKKVTSNIAFA